MNENPLEIENEITSYKALKTKLHKEARKISIESGLVLETVARLQEKKHALSMEAKEREAALKKLENIVQDKLSEQKKDQKLVESSNEKDTYQGAEEKEKVKEKFFALIDRKINSVANKYLKQYLTEAYDIKNDDQTYVNEDDVYLKNPRIWAVTVILEENDGRQSYEEEKENINEETGLISEDSEKHQYVTTFRVGQNTKLIQLKEQAAKFWGKNPNDYDLFDEKGEQINVEEGKKEKKNDSKIERIFRLRLQDLSQLAIIMRPNLQRIQKSKTLELKGAKEIEIKDEGEGQRPKNQLNEYDKYNNLFPKLTAYLPLNKEKVEEKEEKLKKLNNPRNHGETSICMVLIFTLLMVTCFFKLFKPHLYKIFNTISILEHRNLQEQQFQDLNIRSLLDLRKFERMNQMHHLLEYFVENLANLFPITVGSLDTIVGTQLTKLYRPVIVRMYRVKAQDDCPLAIKSLNRSCYFSEYSKNTRQTEEFGNLEFSDFKLTHNLEGVTPGIYGDYDPSAYIIKFDPKLLNATEFIVQSCLLLVSSNSSIAYCKQKIDEVCKDTCPELSKDTEMKLLGERTPFIHPSTKAISVEIDLMDPARGEYFYTQPLLEFSPAGLLVTTVMRIIRFCPSLYDDDITVISEKFTASFSICLGVLLLLFVLYSLIVGGNGKFNLKYLQTFQGVLNILIIGFVFYIHSQIDKLHGYEANNTSISNVKEYPTTADIAETYEKIFILRSCLVGFLIVRLVSTLELNSRVKIVVLSYEKGNISAASLIFILWITILALAATAHYLLGPEDPRFLTLSGSFPSIILMAIGFDTGWLQNLDFSRGFFACLCLYLLFLLLTAVLAGVLVETLRRVYLDYGSDFHKKYPWKLHDYVEWTFSWVPSRIKLKKAKLQDTLNINRLKDNLNLKKLKIPGWKKNSGKTPRDKEEIKLATQA